jgi:hypothetical protein
MCKFKSFQVFGILTNVFKNSPLWTPAAGTIGGSSGSGSAGLLRFNGCLRHHVLV